MGIGDWKDECASEVRRTADLCVEVWKWNAGKISRLADVPISRGRTIKYRNIEIRKEHVVYETQYFADDLRFNLLFY